jgi:hypothetical protein
MNTAREQIQKQKGGPERDRLFVLKTETKQDTMSSIRAPSRLKTSTWIGVLSGSKNMLQPQEETDYIPPNRQNGSLGMLFSYTHANQGDETCLHSKNPFKTYHYPYGWPWVFRQ